MVYLKIRYWKQILEVGYNSSWYVDQGTAFYRVLCQEMVATGTELLPGQRKEQLKIITIDIESTKFGYNPLNWHSVIFSK